MIKVKELGRGDFAGFFALMKKFYLYSGDGTAAETDIRLLFKKALDPKANFTVFIAKEADKSVGMISLTIGESSYKVSPFAWADDFYVEEAWRSRGIGKKLMEKAGASAKKSGCSNILVGVGQNEGKTLRFYKAGGYKDMRCKLLTLPL